MKDLRLLIGGSSSFFFHLQEFSNTLNNLGIESKLVFDADYSDGFPGRKIGKWFQTGKKFTKLIDEYKPDAIFIDRQRHFGINSLKAGIPLFVLQLEGPQDVLILDFLDPSLFSQVEHQ